ncbi:MAG TPA: hypothetical protein DGO89_07950 [Microcoleaceae bacterium UBA9251]|nr:hypothetical protein [Microcoleaceae cyanobacterium UBA9251]
MESASLCEISNLPYCITLKSAINPWAGVSVQVAESDNFSRSPSRCVPVIYLVLAIDSCSFFCTTALSVELPVMSCGHLNSKLKT